MRLIVPKGPTWTCSLCHNRANPARSSFCTICRTDRPQYRFGLCVDGKYYICRTKVTTIGATISVCTVSTKSCTRFIANVDDSEGVTEDGIIAAIRAHVAEKAAEKRAKQMEEGVGFPELEQDEIELATANLEDSGKHEPSLHPPHLARRKSDAPPTIERSGSFLGMFDPGMSLFDTVMHNATTVVYNSKIGQFVSVETLQNNAEGTSGEPVTEHKDLKYVESMRRERVVMTQVVKEVVRRRADETYLYDLHADLDLNRNEWDKSLECAMCERTYPKSQMPGQISFKAIADWKERHGAPYAPTDHRLERVRLHDATRLCIFCSQFFDTDAVDRVDRQALQERIGLSELNLNGPLNCSNTVYKRIFRRAVTTSAELEDRPLSKMRHRVALEQLRFKAQMNSGPETRYTFNPKIPNAVLDQEKVGKFLRTKYGGQSTAGALLLAEKKSAKIKLKPLAGGTGTASSATSSEGTFLTGASTADSTLQSHTTASTTPTSSSSSGARRSLSAGVKLSSSGGGGAAVGKGQGMTKGRIPPVGRVKSEPLLAPPPGRKADILALVNKTYSENLASTAPSLSPTKSSSKTVSFSGSQEGNQPEENTTTVPPVKRRKKSKQAPPEGVAKEVRRPLILKVSAATVVGSDELGKVIEIELNQPVDPVEKADLSVLSPVGNKHIQRSKDELLNPLRGLLQNMQLTKVEKSKVIVPGPEVDAAQEPAAAQSHVPVDGGIYSPSKVKPKKSVRISDSDLLSTQVSAEDVGSPTHKTPTKAKNNNNKTGKAQKSPKSHEKKALAPVRSNSWKSNVNKPVLRDVFDPAHAPAKYRDHSYITRVTEDDDFLVDEAYSEDPADHTAEHALEPAEQSDPESVASLPDRAAAGRYTRPRARSDSFEQEVEEDEYAEDGFEVDEQLSPGQLQDTMEEGGRMDMYNWVSAGPYQPEAAKDFGEPEGNGFSPVMFEASLRGSTSDRMRMLSRGSAGGYFTPSSRSGTANRRYAGRQTPKLLSSAGSGIAPVTPTFAAQREDHRKPVIIKAPVRRIVGPHGGGTTSPEGISNGRYFKDESHSSAHAGGKQVGAAAAAAAPVRARRTMDRAARNSSGNSLSPVMDHAALVEQRKVRRRQRF